MACFSFSLGASKGDFNDSTTLTNPKTMRTKVVQLTLLLVGLAINSCVGQRLQIWSQAKSSMIGMTKE